MGELCGDLCRSTAECPAGQECIFGRWESHELDNVQAACREPECDCRVDTDVCNSNARDGGTARECVRLEGTPCNFMSPCDSGYTCDEFAGDVCRCSDLETCGPVCTSHDDCGDTQVCDETTSACQSRHCLDDSVCPAGYGCIVSWTSRFCAVISSAGVVGDACSSWRDCVSGMCLESVCIEPCTQNADCSGTQTCQTPTFVMEHEAYPFCFDWDPPCADCDGANQFCDYYGSCQTGPVCTTDEDCTTGFCDTSRLACTL